MSFQFHLGRVFWLVAVTSLAPLAAAVETQIFESGGDAGDRFAAGGMSIFNIGGPGVAVSGDVLVCGIYGDDVTGGDQGSAQVFRWSGVDWLEEQKLTSSTGAASDTFGSSVAVCDDVAVVGAPRDDVNGAADQGSVTVFRWNGLSWIEEQQLVASGGAAQDGFGTSVAVNGDVLVVGASIDEVGGNFAQGSVTVFRWNGASWVEEQTLLASDGAAGDTFGCAVSLNGTSIVVGAQGDDVGAQNGQGTARTFRWDGLAWVEEQTLLASGGAAGDTFGASVSVSGDVIVVGARLDQVGGNAFEGSATVYRWNGLSWIEEQQLVSSDGAFGDNFGCSVVVRGNVIACGAFDDEISGNSGQGSTTLFRWDGVAWEEQPKLVSSGGVAEDKYGTSVALSGDWLVVGAPGRDVLGNSNQGAAFVYGVSGAPWSDEGSALAGIFCAPLLVGYGDLAAGSSCGVELSSAAPLATAGLFLAFSSTPVPFKGGTLMAFPFLPPVLLTTSSSGTISLPFQMPSGVPAGTELWVQWAIQDAAAVKGVSLSNAVLGFTP